MPPVSLPPNKRSIPAGDGGIRGHRSQIDPVATSGVYPRGCGGTPELASAPNHLGRASIPAGYGGTDRVFRPFPCPRQYIIPAGAGESSGVSPLEACRWSRCYPPRVRGCQPELVEGLVVLPWVYPNAGAGEPTRQRAQGIPARLGLSPRRIAGEA